MKLLYIFLISTFIPVVIFAQSFSCKIYQYSHYDSANAKIIAESKFLNERIIYERDFGYNGDSCDFIDSKRYSKKKYYLYKDTFLTKEIIVYDPDTDVLFYNYNSSKLLYKVKHTSNDDKRLKKFYQEDYEYTGKMLSKRSEHYISEDNTHNPLQTNFYTYTSSGKIQQDSAIGYTPASDFSGLENLRITIIEGVKYVMVDSSLTKYNYFEGGYASDSRTAYARSMDSFYYSGNNLLTKYVSYNNGLKRSEESYYYNDKNKIKKSEAISYSDYSDGVFSRLTRIYKYSNTLPVKRSIRKQ